MSEARRRAWPMIARVLTVLLACVLTVQLANFTLLQLLPLPQPPVFTTAEVAAALRGKGGDRFRSAMQTGVLSTRPGTESRLRDALARELGVAPANISLHFSGHLARGGPRPGSLYLGPPPIAPPPILVGDFTASLRTQDGRWSTVRPTYTGLAAWRLRLIFWLIVALVTIVPFAWLLARWVSRPIAMFADAAERIGRDPRTDPLAIVGPAEIAHAAESFSEMQRRLVRYVDDRTLMIGAIAHDLRTPLMRMALRLDRLPQEMRGAFSTDIAEMEAMVVAGTTYVRDVTELRPRRRMDLRSLAESVADNYADRGAAVTVLSGERVIINGDAAALKALIDNLVGNAIRYAGDAEIELCRDGPDVIIEVRDHGPGAIPQDLDRLFEPFFRGEASRNRHSGGIGLGLASVRGVARMHGGEASAANREGGGLLVRVVLPG